MAVQNYFANFTDPLGKQDATEGTGVGPLAFQKTISVLAADDDGSTFLILKNVPADAVIQELWYECDAITGGTDYDIGLYNPRTGAVIDKDNYADGVTMASALTKKTCGDGLVVLTHENSKKRVFEVAGHTEATKIPTYDLVLTANTVGSGAGKITFRGTILPNG